ncbi:MAG TPA: SDR family NAD(P)-dependent oxidoreductase [Chloroflexota bacterium]|nr:SDR family NAD(P)-dependent oxidoreductase [Chloroflexota bacterium]
MSARPLAGRHAVVTGGGRGIGAAVALELGHLGADLTLMGRTLGALEAVASNVRDGCGVRAQTLVVDVTDEAGVMALLTIVGQHHRPGDRRRRRGGHVVASAYAFN